MGNSVDDKYLQQVRETTENGVYFIGEYTNSYTSWWCMSEEELEIFALEEEYIIPLYIAYCRYQNLCGISDGGFSKADREEDRQTYGHYLPDNWTEERLVFDDVMAKKFMHEVCKIPMFHCAAYILFKNTQDHRSGLFNYKESHDEDILSYLYSNEDKGQDDDYSPPEIEDDGLPF